MRRIRVALVGVGVSLAVAACGAPRAPLFEAPDLGNATVRLADFKGRPVLLWFWASWSAPSRLALGNLAKLQKTYGPRGLRVLAVALDEDVKTVRRSVPARGLGFPVVLGSTTVVASYFPEGDMRVPTGLLLDGERRVVERYTGYQPVEAFQPALDRLAPAGAASGGSAPAAGPERTAGG